MEPAEILLVEDNASDEELALKALSASGVANRIRVARDGVEAIDAVFGCLEPGAAERLPHLILLDLKLPRMDGLDVLRALKTDPRTAAVPVVVLTASALDRDLIESYDLGVNAYVVKPVDFGQFNAAVRAIGMFWMLYNRTPR